MALRDPLWLENAGAVYNASEYRGMLRWLTFGEEGVAETSDYLVTEQSPVAMGVTVSSGRCVIAGDDSPTTQGMYMVENDADVDLAISSAHPTLDRIDLVCVRIRDSEFAGASDDAEIVIIEGVPGGGTPAIPGNHLYLALVGINGGVMSVTNASVFNTRSLVGGRPIGVAPDSNSLDLTQAGRVFWDTTLERFRFADGSQAVDLAQGASGSWVSYTPTLNLVTLGGGGVVIGAYQYLGGNTVAFRASLVLGSGGSTSPAFGIGLPFDALVPANGFVPCTMWALDSGTTTRYGGSGIILDTEASRVSRFAGGATGSGGYGGTVPFSWAENDSIYVSGIYETA